MRFYTNEKLALVIDGPNTHNTARELGFDIDYSKLHDFFARQAIMVSASYFTLLLDKGEEFNPLLRLLDWLDFNGWQVTARDKDTDVDLAVFALELAERVDHLVLLSGDQDFVSLVEAVQRKGCRVTVLSTLTRARCHDDLRRAANDFMDLKDLRSVLERPRVAREALAS